MLSLSCITQPFPEGKLPATYLLENNTFLLCLMRYQEISIASRLYNKFPHWKLSSILIRKIEGQMVAYWPYRRMDSWLLTFPNQFSCPWESLIALHFWYHRFYRYRFLHNRPIDFRGRYPFLYKCKLLIYCHLWLIL